MLTMAINALPTILIQEIKALRQSGDVARGMRPTLRSKMTAAPKVSLDFRSFSRPLAQEDDTFVVAFAFVHSGGAGGVRGVPPLFLFARGLRGGRLGTRASGPPVFYSIVKLRAAGLRMGKRT